MRPTLDLRANALKADRDKVVKALERAGAEACRLAPQGVRVAAGKLSDRLPNVTPSCPSPRAGSKCRTRARSSSPASSWLRR